jgi:hypothetical protein
MTPLRTQHGLHNVSTTVPAATTGLIQRRGMGTSHPTQNLPWSASGTAKVYRAQGGGGGEQVLSIYLLTYTYIHMHIYIHIHIHIHTHIHTHTHTHRSSGGPETGYRGVYEGV